MKDEIHDTYNINLLKRFIDMKVTKYKILDCSDERVCSLCGVHSSKVYTTDDAVIGKNLPPFHNGCRCIITPVFN